MSKIRNLSRLILVNPDECSIETSQDISDSYNQIKKEAFRGRNKIDSDLCPTFSQNRLNQQVTTSFLNKEGYSALNSLLWVIKFTKPNLRYCPLVANILSILLIFFNESETYHYFKFIYSMNKNLDNDFRSIDKYYDRGELIIRLYLPIDEEEMT